MELWEGLTGIILILLGIGLIAYLIRRLRKEPKTEPQQKVYCSSCGTENSPEASFCVKCGNKIADQQRSTNSEKSEEKAAENKEDSKDDDVFFGNEKDDDLIFPEDGI
jgi:ribosomal protein L40E